MCRALMLATVLIWGGVGGGCKAFRAMFDEDPARRAVSPRPESGPASPAAARSSERTFWGTPKKKPDPFVGRGLSEFERSELRRVRDDELPDRSAEMERDRQKQKDWVFGR